MYVILMMNCLIKFCKNINPLQMNCTKVMTKFWTALHLISLFVFIKVILIVYHVSYFKTFIHISVA